MVSCCPTLLVTYSLSGLVHYANTLGSAFLAANPNSKLWVWCTKIKYICIQASQPSGWPVASYQFENILYRQSSLALHLSPLAEKYLSLRQTTLRHTSSRHTYIAPSSWSFHRLSGRVCLIRGQEHKAVPRIMYEVPSLPLWNDNAGVLGVAETSAWWRTWMWSNCLYSLHQLNACQIT